MIPRIGLVRSQIMRWKPCVDGRQTKGTWVSGMWSHQQQPWPVCLDYLPIWEGEKLPSSLAHYYCGISTIHCRTRSQLKEARSSLFKNPEMSLSIWKEFYTQSPSTYRSTSFLPFRLVIMNYYSGKYPRLGLKRNGFWLCKWTANSFVCVRNPFSLVL